MQSVVLNSIYLLSFFLYHNIRSEADGSCNDAVEQVSVEDLVGAGLRVQEKQLVRDERRIEAFFLEIELPKLESPWRYKA